MNIYRIIKATMFLCVLGLFIYSCEDVESTYSDFLEGGEITYPGKADSIIAYPGDYRIKLSWLLMSDPTVTQSKVFWNNKNDSIEISFERIHEIDTISVLLTNMDERAYTFDIYNYDVDGNKSVKAEALGTVYGDIYRSTLLNRFVQNVSLDNDDLWVEWGVAEETSVGQQITFYDVSGDSHSIYSSNDQQHTKLENIDLNKGFGYSTLFLPDSLAIDTFQSTYEEKNLEVTETVDEIDRSSFSLKDLPGDENTPNKAANSIDNIWTNDYDIDATPFISKAWQIGDCENLVPFPYWFTIDLGTAYDVTSFTLFQRGGSHVYDNNNLREFEIWGALEVDEEYNPKDHGGVFDNNWILLKQCEIIRPADESTWIDEARKGNGFDLRVNGKAQKIRYLRIKAIDNWLPETGPCEVKKRTYINIASIRLEAVQTFVEMK
jgi:hypothetical protein